MGSREFSFDKNAICDDCGHEGAFDIYGDILCEFCLNDIKTSCSEKLKKLYFNKEYKNETKTISRFNSRKYI